jgi:hypothetical protein
MSHKVDIIMKHMKARTNTQVQGIRLINQLMHRINLYQVPNYYLILTLNYIDTKYD